MRIATVKQGAWVACGFLLAACARPGESGGSPSAVPQAAIAVVSGVRYFRGDDAALARGWRGMALSSSELRMLGVETVRLVQVTEMTVENGRTTFVAKFRGHASRCSLEPEYGLQRFTCFGEWQPFTLRELLPPADNADIALLEQQIRDTVPPPGTCDRAEACCKAMWPLLVPGEQCDVGLQLGPGRLPETCYDALRGFRLLSDAQRVPLPAACR